MQATRRGAIGTLAAVGSVFGTVAHAQAPRKTFVLVHGSSAGGWCCRRVADLLEARGHKVYAPTLTGLGERSHLVSGQITLDTHITDVANVIKWEDLDQFVLVGHSYGGWIISGVAESYEKRITSIVFLDAFMPEDGQRVLDTNSARSRGEIEEALRRAEVSRPAPSASVWKVNPKDQPWVDEKFTAQPIGVAFTPIRLTGARDRVPKKNLCPRQRLRQSQFRARLRQGPSRSHLAHLRARVRSRGDDRLPERTAEILLEVA